MHDRYDSDEGSDDYGEDDLCPECEAEVSSAAEVCWNCGYHFVDEEPPEEVFVTSIPLWVRLVAAGLVAMLLWYMINLWF